MVSALAVAVALIGGLFVVGAVALVVLTIIAFRRLTDPRHVTLAHAHAGRATVEQDDDAIDVAATEVVSESVPRVRLIDSPPDYRG